MTLYLLLLQSAVAMPLSPDGFVTGWAIRGTPHLVTGPAVPVHRLAKLHKGTRVTLEAALVSDRAARLRFKLGCTASCELSLDGKRLASLDKPYRAWIDDVERDVDVTAGRHTLEVHVTRKARGGEQVVYFRVHDTSNAVPSFVRVALPAEPPPAAVLVRSLPVRFEKAVEAGGVRVRAVVGPAGRSTEPVRLRLAGDATAETHGERVTLDALVTTRVTLTLEGGGVTRTESTPLRFDAALAGSVTAARATLAATPVTPRLADAIDTAAWGADFLEEKLTLGDDDLPFLRERAAVLDRQVAALRRGEDPLERERGAVFRAYRTPLDGRLQVYALYVPPDLTPAMPLLVALHPSGFHPMLALRIALGVPPDTRHGLRWSTRHLPPLPNPHALVVAPYGFRGTGSRYFGKTDVLDVIDRVRRRYAPDPARVTLSGGSLGGLGSWHVGLRMPDRFNALAPMAGYGSVRLYRDVAGKPLLPWERFLVERRDNATFVENAMHLPMLCIHGENDDPRRSRVIVDRYKKLGFRHTYEELAGKGHNVWDAGYEGGRVMRFARPLRRPERPRTVRFVSGSYRHRSAYWVTIDQFERSGDLGRVQATEKKGAVVVKTDNVHRLTLDLPTAAVVPTLDGQALEPARGRTTFVSGNGGRWRATTAPIPDGEKRAGQSGPIDDVRYGPHVFVYGTADASETDTNRRRAQRAARYLWNDAEIHLPVVADTEVSEQDLRTKDLVLFGSPRSNRVLARMADRLPARWTGDAIEIAGKRFAGPSVGVAFAWPNPLAKDRTIVVYGGVTHRGTWLSAWLPQWLPDWVVYDEGVTVQMGGKVFDRRRTLGGGYFDRTWR